MQWHLYPQGIEVVSLGKIASGHYILRVLHLFSEAFKIRNHEKSRGKFSKIMYAFGLDMAILGHVALGSSIPSGN